jgi:hypothetical protein
MSLIYFSTNRGDESTYNTLTQNTKEAVSIKAENTNQNRTGLIKASQTCVLSVNLQNAGTFTLYNSSFTTVLGSTSSTTPWQNIATLTANTVYGWTYNLTIAPGSGSIIAYLQAKSAASVSNWFPNGFINLLQLGPTVSRITNADGSFTYTFTNYPVTTISPIALLQTGTSIQSGTLTLTSTVGAFANQSEAFTAPSGVISYLVPSSTGDVSGTVTVTVTGAGGSDFVRTVYTNSCM